MLCAGSIKAATTVALIAPLNLCPKARHTALQLVLHVLKRYTMAILSYCFNNAGFSLPLRLWRGCFLNIAAFSFLYKASRAPRIAYRCVMLRHELGMSWSDRVTSSRLHIMTKLWCLRFRGQGDPCIGTYGIGFECAAFTAVTSAFTFNVSLPSWSLPFDIGKMWKLFVSVWFCQAHPVTGMGAMCGTCFASDAFAHCGASHPESGC